MDMSILSPSEPALSAHVREVALLEALENGPHEALVDVLDVVSDAAAAAVHDDVAAIAIERERVGRLLEALADVPRSEGWAYAHGRLEEVDRGLDHARTRALGQRLAEQRARRRGTLRAEIVEQLRVEPRRPGDLARDLDADPAQISRALRALERDGLIELRNDEHDGRGRVCRLRAPAEAR